MPQGLHQREAAPLANPFRPLPRKKSVIGPEWADRRKARAWMAASLILVALALTAGCRGKTDNTVNVQTAKTSATPSDTGSAAAVSVQPARTGDITQTVDVTGSLVALQDVVVGAKQAGKIASVYLREGDPVRAGQVVAAMDTIDLSAQLQQQQANLQSAIAKEALSRAAL